MCLGHKETGAGKRKGDPTVVAPDCRRMGDKKLDVGSTWDRGAGVGDQNENS